MVVDDKVVVDTISGDVVVIVKEVVLDIFSNGIVVCDVVDIEVDVVCTMEDVKTVVVTVLVVIAVFKIADDTLVVVVIVVIASGIDIDVELIVADAVDVALISTELVVLVEVVDINVVMDVVDSNKEDLVVVDAELSVVKVIPVVVNGADIDAVDVDIIEEDSVVPGDGCVLDAIV